MRFTLNGKQYELTANEVRYRLRDVQPEVIQAYGVRVGSRLYPVKQAFQTATGIPRAEFTTQIARRHLAALGFEIIRHASSHTQPNGLLRNPPAKAPGRAAAADAVGDWRDPRPGDMFARRYRIIQFLGEGDRKRTYLALDINLNRRVALALIKPEAMRSDPSGTRREAQTLGQAGGHSNIVPLHDQGVADGVEYLIFQYLSGGTLRDYLRTRRGEPLPLDEVLRLGRQLARALSHVHHQGVIHRDIAPANVWLDERKEAHIGDFDSAVRADTQDSLEALPLTTEAYASPEEIAGKHLDERSDLYSLGAVLYEAATGRRLAPGPGKFAAPRVVRPDIPPGLNAIICKLLSQSPDKRPATADDVLKSLKPASAPLPAKAAILWAETLPFPLASILWHYEGEIEAQSRVEHLLNFFEALAQFLVTIELGALKSDHSLFDANRSAWFGVSPEKPQPLPFRAPTFGTWVTLHQRLSKTVRHMLSGGDDTAQRCCDLFAANDMDPLSKMMSRELGGILDTARLDRNEWRGHGGVTSPQEHARRLGELGDLLTRTEEIIGGSLRAWDLLKPGTTEYTGGIFNYTVAVLMGTNQAFRKRQVRVHQPLDTSRLYLVSRDDRKPLEIAPLIRILPGPKTGEPACYFYNRLKEGHVRWISYHFHAEPEIILDDNYLVQFISELKAD
jgi:serine/threonine protein kinase